MLNLRTRVHLHPKPLIILSFLVVFSAAGCARYDPADPLLPASTEWDRMLGFPKPLEIKPLVVELSRTKEKVTIRITNQSQEPLSYQGTASNRPQEFIEVDNRGQWVMETWDGCGFGKTDQFLAAGQSEEIEVRFHVSRHRERVLVCLTGIQSEQCELVVLATE